MTEITLTIPGEPKGKQSKKVCIKCLKLLPATIDYYHKYTRKIDGLFNICKECRKQEKKQYTANNKEKIKKSSKEYYQRNKEEILKKQRAYYFGNKDKIKKRILSYRKGNIEYWEKQKCYTEKNKERIKQRIKEWYTKNRERQLLLTKKWNDKNCKKRRKLMRQHYENNKDYYYLKTKKRKSTMKNLVSDLTKEQWEECLQYFNYKDAYTGLQMKVVSQDHVVPIIKDGGYTKYNIVPCDKKVNSSKINKDMDEWFLSQPFYKIERHQKINNWLQRGISNEEN